MTDKTKATHTPGPWTIHDGAGHSPACIEGVEDVQVSGWPEQRGTISNRSYSHIVCEIYGDLSLPSPKSNARLIAAAPELLEACRIVCDGIKVDGPETERVYLKVRAAIAKAEGREAGDL